MLPLAPTLDPRRPNLLGMLPTDLEAWLNDRGVACRPEHARRVQSDLVRRGLAEPAPRRPVPGRVLRAIASDASWDRLEVVERVTDESDGFVKYLFRHPDGALSEAVRIPLLKADCFSVCLSSQVGCAMQCAFCATGRLGLGRNLEPWEIVAQYLTVRDEAPGRVTGAVFQGQGEPLHNYDRVLQAARVLCHPCGGGIKAEAITISTVGLVPQIRRFTAERQPYRLIVSLTSAIPERRKALLPVAGCFELRDLADAIGAYAASIRGLATVAWVVMGGVNTGADEVAALRELLDGIPVRLNLIDVNPVEFGDGPTFRRADDAELEAFRDALQVLGVPIVRRYSGGRNRDAACGMLAARRHSAAETSAAATTAGARPT